MERTKWKCVNPDCRVSLKAAEQQNQGSDSLGTALIAPIHCQQRVKETQFGFTIDEKEEGHIFLKQKLEDYHDEFQHVPSNHPDHPVKMVAGDPAFVNPNSSEALKEIMRRVGKAANVKRYNPDDLQSREWLKITVDGLLYLRCRGVVDDVPLCSECGEEVDKLQLEMNMARHFIDLNWDILLSELASELGFVSENAQKNMRNSSDHHKTMSVLKVAHID